MIDPTATHPLLRELNDALAIEGADMVAFSRMVDLKSNGYLAVSMWIPQLLVPVGAVLMGLAAIVSFVAAWRAGPRATVPTSQATGIE